MEKMAKMAKMAFTQKFIQGFFLSVTIEFLGQNTVRNTMKNPSFVKTMVAASEIHCDQNLKFEKKKLPIFASRSFNFFLIVSWANESYQKKN